MATATKTDPIKLLKSDHEEVKGLFDKFEAARSDATKARYARQAITELKIHAAIEEDIFYPAFDAEAKSSEAHDIYLEAEEEHHVAHVLIAELDALPDDDEHFEAKFTVLAENIRHHIKEEETEMLPQAKKAKLDMEELGAQMQERKQELKSKGVPASSEEKLLAEAAR